MPENFWVDEVEEPVDEPDTFYCDYVPTEFINGKPVVDPPEFDARIRDSDKEAYWIPAAFPTIFQNETGDPHNFVDKEPDLEDWGPHILRSRGWLAQAHMTFMYWWTNMLHRMKVLSAKKWFIRDNPLHGGYTAKQLREFGVDDLAKRMVGYTAHIPGTQASKRRLRRIILTMVRQIEIETSDGDKRGDVPSIFGTLTSQRYNWDGIIKIIAQVEGITDYSVLTQSQRRALVNKYPLFVAYYCSVRLEMTLKAIVVPYYAATNYVAVFEWSPTGGMVHLHYILWGHDVPRWDMRAKQMQRARVKARKARLPPADYVHVEIKDIIEYFSRYISEFNPNKNSDGEELIDHVAEKVNDRDNHPAAVSIKEMLKLLEPDKSAERHAYYNHAVRCENMHDFHYPDPVGPPAPSQPCAKLLKGTTNIYHCANGYPRDLVPEGEESIAQDSYRSELWRANLRRNCPCMNCHMPLVAFALQSNSDAQPVLTRNQAEMYCCKYCSKHTKRPGARSSLFDVIDEMEDKDKYAKDVYGEDFDEETLGKKLHKVFMGEIGEEVCQAEIAHWANKSPEYLVSRPVKNVAVFAKWLSIAAGKRQERAQQAEAVGGYAEEGDGDEAAENDEAEDEYSKATAGKSRHRVRTSMSDMDVYEQRAFLYFREGTKPVPYLPMRDTPEEQVVDMCLWDFFRFVKYHGGQRPWIEWHDPEGKTPWATPIVCMTPSYRLRIGPDLPFGARWSLVQYHPWQERTEFLGLGDKEVEAYFLKWVQEASCPWFIVEQYEKDNNMPLNSTRGKRNGKKQETEANGEEGDAEEEKEDEQSASCASSETCEATDDSNNSDVEHEKETRVLKVLRDGGIEEKNRREEQMKKVSICAVVHIGHCASVAW